MVLYILIFVHLNSKLEDKKICTHYSNYRLSPYAYNKTNEMH